MLILEYLSDAEAGISLAEMSRILSVNKNIAYRIISTLEQLGYIFRNDATEKYFLTYKISNIGFRQLSSSHLLDPVKKTLYNLVDKSGELVRLALVDDDELLWVFAAAGKTHRLQIGRVDTDISLHGHAAGKAWLATLADDEIKQKLNTSLEKFTDSTIVSLEAFLRQIAEIRQTGYSVSWEEREKGVVAVASPIRINLPSGATKCVGSLSIAAPSPRVTPEVIERFGLLLIDTSKQLSDIWPMNEVTLNGFVDSDNAY